VGTDDAQQSKSRWVRQYTQGSRQPLGILFVEGLSEELRAALCVDRLDEFHPVILTAVDIFVNVSTFFDASHPPKEVPSERSLLPGGLLPIWLLLGGRRAAGWIIARRPPAKVVRVVEPERS
jgi:hypothetical protein